jgi:hypothetical protein
VPQAGWAPDPAFGLGAAGDFAVLSLGKPSADTDGQSKLDLSAVTVHGDVGVGPFGVLDFQGPSTIHGDLYIDPTLLPQDILSDVGTVIGERVADVDLSGAVADALAAAADNSALSPTHNLGRLKTSAIVHGLGGMNVVALDGLDFSRSNPGAPLILALAGGPEDLFVLNVRGKFVLGPGARIEGVDPSRVLVNVGPGTTPVQFASDSYVGGTLLSPDRKMGPLQGASGPVIGAWIKEISLVGGAILNPPPASLLAVIVADPLAVVDQPVQLDGSASTSPTGEPLTYEWSLTSKPAESFSELSAANIVNPYFIPDVTGDYQVELVVCDGAACSDPVTENILVMDAGDMTDLSLEITDDPDPVARKTPLAYTLDVVNQGVAEAAGVELTANLSMAVKTITVDPPDLCNVPIPDDPEVTCGLGSIEPGAGFQVIVEVVPKKAGTLILNGSVVSVNSDANASDNSAFEETSVTK